eukprot:Nitzschia sp. Nitz4//scaffold7_size249615//86824//89908//NITZ4_001163-RA/size249615-processed-gene-0.135-mRNA-1//1//CDS//3329558400//7216//frame0
MTNNSNMFQANFDNVDESYEVPYSSSRGNRSSGNGGRVSNNNNNSNSNNKKKARFEEVDMDKVFDPFQPDKDDVGEFFDPGADDDSAFDFENEDRVYNDPKKNAVLDEGVHQIPGSPWAKPVYRPSTRPPEPLYIASLASVLSLFLTAGTVIFLLYRAIWEYTTAARLVIEVILALVSFFGLFWNAYFTVGSICKCFIPAKAFRTNTKYCSMIPEEKRPNDEWLDCTIQIPVYKESLQEVLMPTLKSCIASRDYYNRVTGSKVNIVMCDDGMMALLKDNFAAAEMLWETIDATNGRVFKLSQLLQKVPRPSRRHLKGLSSRSVYEVFHRMLFYYHYDIGFVARSTHDRRGKFKKASNVNTHLRLVWGAEQIAISENISFAQGLVEASHHADGSRFTMFGGDVSIGDLIIVNDADARMAETVIVKTVPEFLNDQFLGFTQHATKTMDDQRGESYYINMCTAYTDALYQGHFLLSSILGCHPPLVGHSIFLRSEAVKQCGRIRTLRKTQRWLKNIGLPFLSIDQVGIANLNSHGSTEFWSENHVSEDFELMIHLYYLGFNGRYVAYPDCEFQEGITRTFDEEAGRHRKFALGAHELMFNPFNNWFGNGIWTPLFSTFLNSDIPSYYKIYLTAYLFSYTSGGIYICLFVTVAIARLAGVYGDVNFLTTFNSAGVLVMSVVVYYVIGYTTFLIAMLRMHWANKKLLFPEYRQRIPLFLISQMIRYCMCFQLLFYSVMGNYFFLGSMDHLLSRPGIVGATNKDSIKLTRCVAFADMVKFNSGSWSIAILILALSYATWLERVDWDYTMIPDIYDQEHFDALLFAAPASFMAILAFIIPIILNPFILGWPFNPPLCGSKQVKTKSPNVSTRNLTAPGSKVVDLHTFMATSDAADKLEREAGRVQDRPDVELGSLATNDLGGASKGYPISVANPRDVGSPVRHYYKQPAASGKGQSAPAQRSNAQKQSRPTGRPTQGATDKNRMKLAMI